MQIPDSLCFQEAMKVRHLVADEWIPSEMATITASCENKAHNINLFHKNPLILTHSISFENEYSVKSARNSQKESLTSLSIH